MPTTELAPTPVAPPAFGPELLRMLKALNDLVSGDGAAEFFAEDYLPTFQTEMPRRMGELQRHIASQAAPDVRREAHTIKSMLRDSGEKEAAAIAYQLELAGEHNTLDPAPALYGQLQAALPPVMARVQTLLTQFQTELTAA